MTRDVTTKVELLADIEVGWRALHDVLEGVSETQMTTLQDHAGWTIRDHLAHLMVWERSVVYYLQGKPRYEGLGVEEALYEQGDEDLVNERIWQQHQVLTVEEVQEQLQLVHQQLLALVEPFTDADLQAPYRPHGLQEDEAESRRSVLGLIYGNTAHHFVEHAQWLRALVRKA